MKASKLISNKYYTLNALKLTVALGVLASSITGAYIDYYIIPDKLKGNGLKLCHTIFIMLEESIDATITIIYIIIFYRVKKSILFEERIDAV